MFAFKTSIHLLALASKKTKQAPNPTPMPQISKLHKTPKIQPIRTLNSQNNEIALQEKLHLAAAGKSVIGRR